MDGQIGFVEIDRAAELFGDGLMLGAFRVNPVTYFRVRARSSERVNWLSILDINKSNSATTWSNTTDQIYHQLAPVPLQH